MRILFTCVAGSDQHLFCLLPLARAALAAGDEVMVASGPDRAAQVAAHGLPFQAAGHDFATLVREARERLPDLRLGGEDEEVETFSRFFAGLAAPPAAADLLRIVDAFEPDLLVHEPAELGGPLAAAARGVAWATHDWGLPIPAAIAAAVGSAVAPLWRAQRLDPPAHGGLYEQTHVAICPPSLRRTGPATLPPAAPAVQHLRPSSADGGAVPPGDRGCGMAWADDTGSRPVVHVSLGSAAFNQAFDLLRFVVDAVAAEDVTVVVTVGRGNDLRAAGPARPKVHAEAFVPHALLLPHCDAVVTHGGSGTVLAALEHGVPMLVLPLGADQYRMADAVVENGAGMSLRGRVTHGQVRRAVRRLLDHESYRRVARGLAGEIAAMPSAADALVAIKSQALAR